MEDHERDRSKSESGHHVEHQVVDEVIPHTHGRSTEPSVGLHDSYRDSSSAQTTESDARADATKHTLLLPTSTGKPHIVIVEPMQTPRKIAPSQEHEHEHEHQQNHDAARTEKLELTNAQLSLQLQEVQRTVQMLMADKQRQHQPLDAPGNKPEPIAHSDIGNSPTASSTSIQSRPDEQTPLLLSRATPTLRSTLSSSPNEDEFVEVGKTVPGWSHASPSRRAESVGQLLVFVGFWIIWANTVEIYDSSSIEALWSEGRNAIDVLGLIGSISVGAFLGGVICDVYNWKRTFEVSATLVLTSTFILLLYTLILFTRQDPPHGWVAIQILRWCSGIGAGTLLPLAIHLTLVSVDKIEDVNVRMMKLAKLLLACVLAQFTSAVVSMAAFGLESMIGETNVNGTVGLCHNLTQVELILATVAERKKIMFHSIVMGLSTIAIVGYAGVRVWRLDKDHGYAINNELIVGQARGTVAKFVWGNKQLLGAACVPWLFAGSLYHGRIPTAMIAMEAIVLGLAETNWYQFQLLYVLILVVPGQLLGYLFVTRFDLVKVQLIGFALLVCTYMITGALQATLPDSAENERLMHWLEIINFIIVTAGPQSSTFMLAVDTLPKHRPALFYGIAVACSQLGALGGWYLFNVFLYELSVREELCYPAMRHHDDVTFKNIVVTITLAVLGGCTTWFYKDFYSEKERRERRHLERVSKNILPHELSCTAKGQFKIKHLGHGSFGDVQLSTWDDSTHPQKYVALKIYKGFDEGAEEKIMSELKHKNVVVFYGSGINSVADGGEYAGQKYIVLEYMDNGTLRDYLKTTYAEFEEARKTVTANGTNSDLYRKEVTDLIIKHQIRQHEWGIDVAEAIVYLHAQGIFHRDLKCENCLVNSDGVVKVSDFGTAKKFLVTSKAVGSLLGSVAYHAPEQFRGKSGKVEADWAKVDVYAFGFVLFEIATNRARLRNWEDKFAYKIHIEVGPAPPKLNESDQVSTTLRSVIENCFQFEAKSRKKASVLLEELKCGTPQFPTLSEIVKATSLRKAKSKGPSVRSLLLRRKRSPASFGLSATSKTGSSKTGTTKTGSSKTGSDNVAPPSSVSSSYRASSSVELHSNNNPLGCTCSDDTTCVPSTQIEG